MLQVKGVYAGYYRDINILQGVEITAREANLTSIIGTNGVGKSTLLKTIYGFLKPNQGEISWQEQNITGANPFKMPKLGLTYIPQRRNVFPEMTVEENLLLGAWTFRNQKQKVLWKLQDNYQRFPVLRERRKQKAGNFSGGQQRMVELGRAMMIDPRLMLVDEPTAGLAPLVAREIYDKLVELKQEGITILLVDQNIKQAIEVSDYVYALALGKNLTEGPREDFANLKEQIKEWL
jgi:branched-chain amino acid transport system ATP-binding protein